MIQIRDRSLTKLGEIGKIDSLSWKKYYSQAGAFELKCPYSAKNAELLADQNFICVNGNVGIIEYVDILDDFEGGSDMTVKGRDVKALLDWRINWNILNFSGTVEDFLRRLVDENMVHPSAPYRAIDIIALGDKTGITDRIEIQDTGTSLLKIAQEITPQYQIGFDFDLVDKKLLFRVYRGQDRSSTAKFSRAYNNVLSQDIVVSSQKYKNTCWIAGAGDGIDRRKASIESGAGLSRREMYVDARDLNDTERVDGTEKPVENYERLLIQRGTEKLAECPMSNVFDIEPDGNSKHLTYHTDYDLGDVVSCVDKQRGIRTKQRITEIDEIYQGGNFSISLVLGNDLAQKG